MPNLIHAYDQSHDPRWFAGEVIPERLKGGAYSAKDFVPTDTSRGVCFGLSIWWIIKTAKNVNFWTWMRGAGPQVADIKGLFLSQHTAGIDAGENIRFGIADDMIQENTTLVRKTRFLPMVGFKEIGAGYFYFSLRGRFQRDKEVSGHAIAMYLNDNEMCRYFDPNKGEYTAMTVQDTLAGLNSLIMSYKIRNLNVYWGCWGGWRKNLCVPVFLLCYPPASLTRRFGLNRKTNMRAGHELRRQPSR